MASTTDELLARALALPPEERERMLRGLIDSLEEDAAAAELSTEEWEAAWSDELAGRVREIRDGTVELIDGDEAMRRARTALRPPRK